MSAEFRSAAEIHSVNPRESSPVVIPEQYKIDPDPDLRKLLIKNIEETCQIIPDCEDKPSLVDNVFNEEGEWILKGEDKYPDFYELPPFQVRNVLREELASVYRLVNYRLREDKYPDGYNGHDQSHIRVVSERTESLLRLAGQKEGVIALGIAAAEGHDLGNVKVRKGHSLESPAILVNVVPSVLNSPGKWGSVETAIKLHDEKAIGKEIHEWESETIYDDVQKLRELGPLVNALIIADKTDMGRHRTNLWATSLQVLERDTHAFVNFFGESKGLDLTTDEKGNKRLTWRIGYSPDVLEEEYKRFGALARKRKFGEGVAALVPQWLQDLNKQGRSNHFDGWWQEFMHIYNDRIELTALNAFALFPTLKYFRVEAKDQVDSVDPEVGMSKKETYSLDLFEKHRKQREAKYFPKAERPGRGQNGDHQV